MSQIPPPNPLFPSEISISERMIRIRDKSAFQVAENGLRERFLRSLFSISEVDSVAIDAADGSATIRHKVKRPQLAEFLGRVALALRGETVAESRDILPLGVFLPNTTVQRHGAILTVWDVASDSFGRLRLRHNLLSNDRILAKNVERALLAMPGVSSARAGWLTPSILIYFDTAITSAARLIRAADDALLPAPISGESLKPVKFGFANASLGIAVIGEFAVPALLPISAVLLIGSNLRLFKEAGRDIRDRRLGLPVLYSAIIATTLLGGQFIASSLMSWMFKFWKQRFEEELASQRTRILNDCLPQASVARLCLANNDELIVTTDRLNPGDLVKVGSGELVPADGQIFDGEAVVDERRVRGLEGITRKKVGDPILAGSLVLAGEICIEVKHSGERTHAASIRRALIAATSPTPGSLALTKRSETFASKAIGPTLATAGVGLLAGDLTTASAILRPDYATGPGLSVPLETLRDVAFCAIQGIIVQAPDSFEKLDQTDLVILDDHPALEKTAVEVHRIETKLPESLLLQYTASAFRHLHDDRVGALEIACRSRSVHLLNLEAVDFGQGVTVVHGKHQIRVREENADGGATGPLLVEIDGALVGRLEFARTSRLEAAATLDHIREFGPVRFALISSRPQSEIAGLAASLGVEIHRGDLSIREKIGLLRACRDRGLHTLYVGDCGVFPEVAAEAEIAISFIEDVPLGSRSASILLPRNRIAALAKLWEIARANTSNARKAQRFILVPNLFCIAGAFLFGFNGLTSVMVSNLGTFGLYRHATDSLRGVFPNDRRFPR